MCMRRVEGVDILGREYMLMDDERAESWARLMNWDLEVKIKNCEYSFLRKKNV